MMHGPCGFAKNNATCMKNSFCSKKFPKQIRNETLIDENGIISYNVEIQIFLSKKKTLN